MSLYIYLVLTSSVLYFAVYRSWQYLVKFIHKYFSYIFNALVNYSLSNSLIPSCPLMSYRNTTSFDNSEILAKFTHMISSSFFGRFCKVSYGQSCDLQKDFSFFLQIQIPFYFFRAVSRTSCMMLKRSVRSLS